MLLRRTFLASCIASPISSFRTRSLSSRGVLLCTHSHLSLLSNFLMQESNKRVTRSLLVKLIRICFEIRHGIINESSEAAVERENELEHMELLVIQKLREILLL